MAKSYLCPRCGYKTSRVNAFKSHLFCRAKICDPTVADCSLDNLKQKYITPVVIPEIPPAAAATEPSVPRAFSVSTKIGATKACQTNTTTSTSTACQTEPDPAPPAALQLLTATSAPPTALSIMTPPTLETVIEQLYAIKAQTTNTAIAHNITDAINLLGLNHANTANLQEFERENVNFVLDDMLFMRTCIQLYIPGIVQYIRETWFNEKYAHTRNIKVVNYDRHIIEYFQFGRWNRIILNNKFLDKLLGCVGNHYQIFLERAPIFPKDFLDDFMSKIGAALEWDLDHREYTFDQDTIDQEECKSIKENLYKIIKSEIFNFI